MFEIAAAQRLSTDAQILASPLLLHPVLLAHSLAATAKETHCVAILDYSLPV